MFIKRVYEGSYYPYGLSWKKSENTLFSLHLTLPIWLKLPKEYEKFDTRNIFYGWQVKVLFLRLRIRNPKNFPSNVSKILYSASTSLRSFGKQILIATCEQRMDRGF